MTKLVTSYPYPWALICRNGGTPGKRYNTALAWIKEAVAKDGRVVAYKVYIWSAQGKRWTKTVRQVDCTEVVKEWRHQPTLDAIRRAKKRVPIVPAPESDRRAA